MFRHFPVGAKTVLDAGSNTGRGGRVLKSLDPGLEIVGLDCVPERVEKLDPAVYSKSFCCFGDKIPVSERSLDVIVGGEFIEHVPPVQVDPTLAEFFRVLKLRGRIILTTPNPHYIKNKIKGLSVLTDTSHTTQHYPANLAWRLRHIGFSRVKIFGSGRVSGHLGERIPFLPIYGSYLIQADKW
jgi:SAM-dependent methyltransferase